MKCMGTTFLSEELYRPFEEEEKEEEKYEQGDSIECLRGRLAI